MSSINKFEINGQEVLFDDSKLKQIQSNINQLSASENLLDMTPDYIGKYYSAGGVLSNFTTYYAKEIDLTNLQGKYIKFNLAYKLLRSEYCFIKKNDDSYTPLKNNLVFEGKDYSVFYVKENYKTLQASWDTHDNPNAFITVLDTFIIQDDYEHILNDYFYQGITDAKISSDLFTKNSTNSFLLNEEKIGYNKVDDTFIEDDNWRTTIINLKQLDIIKIKMRIVPSVVLGIKIFNTDQKEIYRNSFDSLYIGPGISRIIDFVYLAKVACDIELSYYKNSLMIFTPKNITDDVNYIKECLDDFYVDLSNPDHIGQYYSAGGVLSSYPNYECKEIEITPIMKNVSLNIRTGNSSNIGEYCFVLLDDDTYVPLRAYIQQEYDTFINIVLPDNAIKLQLSWDTKDLNNVYFVKQSFMNTEFKEIKNIVNKINGTQISILNNNWQLEQYWSTGGQLSYHNNYKATTINIENYKNQYIYVSMGFGTPDNPTAYLSYCWVQTDTDQYQELNSYPCELVTNGYIVKLPNNVKNLEVCYDTKTKEPNAPYVKVLEDGEISLLNKRVESLENKNNNMITTLSDKNIFLFGDSISSTDYTWFKDYLKKYTGAANVYNQGASGRNTAYQASNEYFDRLNIYPSDVIIALVGGNDSGEEGTIGTFYEDSELAKLGETIVSETDITIDYNGTKFIQAVSHIIRKWKAEYYDFRLNANLSAKIVSASDKDTSLYEGTEKECIDYAKSQGWELGYGKQYYMISTETIDNKRTKLLATKIPKLYFCTTLPQKRYNTDSIYSNPQNWERKRLAVIECCKKYEIPCIDLAKEFMIDWDKEPFWPGQGYSSTSKTDNQGIYTMDGLHPNEFGYDYISQIICKHII